jgi:N-acetylglucosamine repressor
MNIRGASSTGKVDNRGMREINRALLLDLIRRGGRISRTDLARRSLLTKPTVSAIVDELLRDNVVREVGFDESTAVGGRPARLLEFNDDWTAYLAVHFGVRTTQVGVTDARGALKAVVKRPTVRGAPSRAIKLLGPMVDEVLAEARVPRSRLQVVGAAVPGPVSQRDGVCRVAPNLGWIDVPVREALSQSLGLPAVVYNIAQAAAVAEGRVGVARGVESFVWLYVGTGVGSGIVVDGQLFFGARGFSGEIGHCAVSDEGELCGCGQRGCLETVASGAAIARAAQAAVDRKQATRLKGTQGAIDAPAVVAAARAGDPVASEILARAAGHLAKGVAYLVNLLDPEMVVVGGGVIDAGDSLLEPLRAAFAKQTFLSREIPVIASSLGKHAELMGAALLAVEHTQQDVRVVTRGAVKAI